MNKEELEACKAELAELEASLTPEAIESLSKEDMDQLVNTIAQLKVKLDILSRVD